MSPEDVRPEWVDKAKYAIERWFDMNQPVPTGAVRDALAAVLPEAMAEALEEELGSLATTVREDLDYQRKLEAQIERVREFIDEGANRHDVAYDEIRDLLATPEPVLERDQYKAGAQELGAYLIDVTAKIALLREMVHAWDTRAADPGKSPDGLISDIREVLA